MALGDALGVRRQREPVILVLNPLNWNRTDLVRIPRAELGRPEPVALRDAATHALLPAQVDGSELVFLARDVPSVGYALYTVEAASALPAAVEESISKGIKNARDRISFDKEAGSVQSIVDRQTGRDYRGWISAPDGTIRARNGACTPCPAAALSAERATFNRV